MSTTYHKTTGIVLKAKPFSEADKLLTIYTAKIGKIHVLAKGARKMKSRLGGRLDVLNCCSLYLAKGKSFYIVSECETLEVFQRVKQDYDTLALGLYCAGLLNNFTPWEEKQKNLFDLMLHILLCLNESNPHNKFIPLENAVMNNGEESKHNKFPPLEKGEGRPSEGWVGGFKNENHLRVLRCFFQFKLLAFCGYRPRFERCMHCGREENLFYSLHERGAVCSTCIPEGGARFSLSPDDINLLHRLAKAKNAKQSFSYSKQTARLLEALLEEHLV